MADYLFQVKLPLLLMSIQEPQQILYMENSHNIIHALFINRKSCVFFLPDQLHYLFISGTDGKRHNIGPLRHDLIGSLIVEIKDINDHLPFSTVNSTLFLTHIDHHADFLLSDLFITLAGVNTEKPYKEIGGQGKKFYKG